MLEVDDLLLSLAKESLEHGLLHEAPAFKNPRLLPSYLVESAETYVSLKYNGNRGCIGNFLHPQPLFHSVLTNAFRSGFRDPRFPPVNANVLHHSTVSISRLREKKSWICDDLEQVCSLVQPDDSIAIHHEGRHALMLSSMQAEYGSVRRFVTETRAKVGKIPSDLPYNKLVITIIKTTQTKVVPYREIPCLDFA